MEVSFDRTKTRLDLETFNLIQPSEGDVSLLDTSDFYQSMMYLDNVLYLSLASGKEFGKYVLKEKEEIFSKDFLKFLLRVYEIYFKTVNYYINKILSYAYSKEIYEITYSPEDFSEFGVKLIFNENSELVMYLLERNGIRMLLLPNGTKPGIHNFINKEEIYSIYTDYNFLRNLYYSINLGNYELHIYSTEKEITSDNYHKYTLNLLQLSRVVKLRNRIVNYSPGMRNVLYKSRPEGFDKLPFQSEEDLIFFYPEEKWKNYSYSCSISHWKYFFTEERFKEVFGRNYIKISDRKDSLRINLLYISLLENKFSSLSDRFIRILEQEAGYVLDTLEFVLSFFGIINFDLRKTLKGDLPKVSFPLERYQKFITLRSYYDFKQVSGLDFLQEGVLDTLINKVVLPENPEVSLKKIIKDILVGVVLPTKVGGKYFFGDRKITKIYDKFGLINDIGIWIDLSDFTKVYLTRSYQDLPGENFVKFSNEINKLESSLELVLEEIHKNRNEKVSTAKEIYDRYDLTSLNPREILISSQLIFDLTSPGFEWYYSFSMRKMKLKVVHYLNVELFLEVCQIPSFIRSLNSHDGAVYFQRIAFLPKLPELSFFYLQFISQEDIISVLKSEPTFLSEKSISPDPEKYLEFLRSMKIKKFFTEFVYTERPKFYLFYKDYDIFTLGKILAENNLVLFFSPKFEPYKVASLLLGESESLFKPEEVEFVRKSKEFYKKFGIFHYSLLDREYYDLVPCSVYPFKKRYLVNGIISFDPALTDKMCLEQFPSEPYYVDSEQLRLKTLNKEDRINLFYQEREKELLETGEVSKLYPVKGENPCYIFSPLCVCYQIPIRELENKRFLTIKEKEILDETRRIYEKFNFSS